MKAVSATLLDTLRDDWQLREEKLREVVEERLGESPPPTLPDSVIRTFPGPGGGMGRRTPLRKRCNGPGPATDAGQSIRLLPGRIQAGGNHRIHGPGLGTRRATERARIGHSPPTVARAPALNQVRPLRAPHVLRFFVV